MPEYIMSEADIAILYEGADSWTRYALDRAKSSGDWESIGRGFEETLRIFLRQTDFDDYTAKLVEKGIIQPDLREVLFDESRSPLNRFVALQRIFVAVDKWLAAEGERALRLELDRKQKELAEMTQSYSSAAEELHTLRAENNALRSVLVEALSQQSTSVKSPTDVAISGMHTSDESTALTKASSAPKTVEPVGTDEVLSSPPIPGDDGTWEDTFDWYHSHGHECRTLFDLARRIHLSYSTVRKHHALYRAQHGSES